MTRRVVWGTGLIALALALLATLAGAATASASVLLVCNNASAPGGCGAGTYHTIQAAVDAASPGDWVLVWPGVYHEAAVKHPGCDDPAGVCIAKADLHLRGMSRNGVIVDGTMPGDAQPCTERKGLQEFNRPGDDGGNGILVFKTDGTYVENLTVCNYLTNKDGEQGNEIWWNGGDGTGKIGMGSYWGNYLSATDTYAAPGDPHEGEYALFASNAKGPGSMTHSYGSNMADSVFYIGACQDCNQTIDDVHAENSALGFSGTNAGGHLVIENSEWDLNRSGIVPNSLNNDDAPPPQDGRCPPKDATSPSCTFILNNHVHDNNNPNVPGAGIAGQAPIGTGIELVGTSFVTVRGNAVDHNDSWGIVAHEYPDTETPPSNGLSDCQGGNPPNQPGSFCDFPSNGNVITGNKLAANGSYGNPSNGDLANQPATSNPRNCFSGNSFKTSDPPNIESVDGPPCDMPGTGDTAIFGSQLVCASGLPPVPCPGASYPPAGPAKMLPLPSQPTMPNPCQGVPDDPWCRGGRAVAVVPACAMLRAAASLGLPGSCTCVDRRRFTFRLRKPRHDRLVSVKVLVNGRVVLRRRHGGFGRVTIRRLPQGRFTVKIVARTRRGRIITSVRTYRGCAKSRPRTRTRRRHHR
jgi:Right handed beta helix region